MRLIFHMCTNRVDKIYTIIIEISRLLSPTYIKGRHFNHGRKIKCNDNSINKIIEYEKEYYKYTIEAVIDYNEVEKNRCLFAVDNEILNVSLIIDYMSFSRIRKDMEKIIVKYSVFAYEHDLTDDVVQNIEIASELSHFNIKPSRTYIDNNNGWEMVNMEYNPGHLHKPFGIIFGSWYRMWVGKMYYKYIKKEMLRAFECFENVVLDNDVTRITLYENIEDYNKPENREIQWRFRKELHIDEIAHALEKKEQEEYVPDPEIEIREGMFEHGGCRKIYTYLKDAK